jgi:hypothetical protein
MRRLVFVFLFMLASLATWAPSPATAQDDLPDAPQAESGDLEFSVERVIRGDEFDAPLNFERDDEGRTYLLVSLRVENTGSDERNLNSGNFALVDGTELIGSSGDTSSRAQDAIGLRAMGDSIGYDLKPGIAQVFVLGWRLAVDLDDVVLNIDYDGADRIDLAPWLEQDIDPDELRPPDVAPFRTEDGSYLLGETLGQEEDDTQFTATSYQFVDGIDLGFDYLQPRGKYVVVSFTLYVPGREPRTFDIDQLNLYAESTDQFTSYDFDATLFYNDAGNSLIYEELQPGLSYSGNVVFDVSLEAENFWLAIGNNTDEPLAAIHLDPVGSAGSSGGGDGSSGDLVTDCAAFSDYDEAQAYYADNPDAQPYIDPDVDGLACEVFFGRG